MIDRLRWELVQVTHLIALYRARGLSSLVLDNQRKQILEEIQECTSNESSERTTS